MKPFAWRFWITFTLCIGSGPGLGVGVAIGSTYKSFWIGLAAGILVVILTVVVAALWYRRVMRRRDPSFTFSRNDFRSEANFVLPIPADDAYDLCMAALKALPNFFPTIALRHNYTIVGVTGGGSAGYLSFGSPGEKLSVEITAMTPTSSSAFVRSQPGTVLVVLDFGKNRENINSISNHINRALQSRQAEAIAATERAEMQRALTAAKLSALQAQIEPHFLYNTLANAQSLTRTDAARADAMLGHLITFLRLSLPANDNKTSSLGQEIERVAAYLEIMKIRMGNRLGHHIEMDKTLSQHAFAPLMLQTLVENAIKHGIEPKIGGGMITIRAHKDGDELCVEVIDDGLGLSTATSGSGIGLKNIRERLQLAYADNARLLLQPNPVEGMTATICIPLEKYK
jgi:signal transduction histidine kinase